MSEEDENMAGCMSTCCCCCSDEEDDEEEKEDGEEKAGEELVSELTVDPARVLKRG